jgi:PPM family protein phosphatase
VRPEVESRMLCFTYHSYQPRSHVGLVRTNNEDSGFAGPYVQLVADGVGGAAAGEVASATTAYVVSALAARAGQRDLVDLLSDAIQQSHEQLRAGVASDPSRAGMATTLTAVLTYHDRFAIAHIGDSRAYLLRGASLVRLTTDHTLVQALVDDGQLAPQDVATHPYRSAVLRSVDAETPPKPDVSPLDLAPGDRLMICSDGLTDMISDHEIAQLLTITDPDSATSALIAAALEAGGRDNITCLVADVEDGPIMAHHGSNVGAAFNPYLVVNPAAVRLAPPA